MWAPTWIDGSIVLVQFTNPSIEVQSHGDFIKSLQSEPQSGTQLLKSTVHFTRVPHAYAPRVCVHCEARVLGTRATPCVGTTQSGSLSSSLSSSPSSSLTWALPSPHLSLTDSLTYSLEEPIIPHTHTQEAVVQWSVASL